LAERLQAKVFILNAAQATGSNNRRGDWLEEALMDLVNSARQAGVRVSYHTAFGFNREEILDLVRKEGVDLLVFGVDGRYLRRSLLRLEPRVVSRIVQVKEKDHSN
jgi:nucleotide-binding universal stress UspA family protein